MKRLIALRKRYQAFGRGTHRVPPAGEPPGARLRARVRARRRSWSSRTCRASSQYVELDLSAFAGVTPGRDVRPHGVPADRRAAVLRLTLGPHAFYLVLARAGPAQFGRGGRRRRRARRRRAGAGAGDRGAAGESCLEGQGEARSGERCCSTCCRRAAGSRGKARTLRGVEIAGDDPVCRRAGAVLALLRVDYAEARPRLYALPLAFAPDADPERRSACARRRLPRVARLESDTPEGTGLLYDPFGDPEISRQLLAAIERGGASAASATSWPPPPRRSFAELARRGGPGARAAQGRAEQHLGPLRRPADPEALPQAGAGDQPRPRDRPLPDRADRFRHSPRVAGALEIRDRRHEPIDARHPAGVRRQRGGRLELHAGRPRPLLRARALDWGRSGPARCRCPPSRCSTSRSGSCSADDFERIGTYRADRAGCSASARRSCTSPSPRAQANRTSRRSRSRSSTSGRCTSRCAR